MDHNTYLSDCSEEQIAKFTESTDHIVKKAAVQLIFANTIVNQILKTKSKLEHYLC